MGGERTSRGPVLPAVFHMFADRELPDAYGADVAGGVSGLRTWQLQLRRGVGLLGWTTFNTWQWDLNWHNPDVFYEFADLILWLANLGVECLRLDAIAFIFKRMGTNRQNQPEVHAITQALRAVARIAAPALIFKAEAIVGPADLAPYLGWASTPARSVTWRTRTLRWCRSGLRWLRRTPGSSAPQ